MGGPKPGWERSTAALAARPLQVLATGSRQGEPRAASDSLGNPPLALFPRITSRPNPPALTEAHALQAWELRDVGSPLGSQRSEPQAQRGETLRWPRSPPPCPLPRCPCGKDSVVVKTPPSASRLRHEAPSGPVGLGGKINEPSRETTQGRDSEIKEHGVRRRGQAGRSISRLLLSFRWRSAPLLRLSGISTRGQKVSS